MSNFLKHISTIGVLVSVKNLNLNCGWRFLIRQNYLNAQQYQSCIYQCTYYLFHFTGSFHSCTGINYNFFNLFFQCVLGISFLYPWQPHERVAQLERYDIYYDAWEDERSEFETFQFRIMSNYTKDSKPFKRRYGV